MFILLQLILMGCAWKYPLKHVSQWSKKLHLKVNKVQRHIFRTYLYANQECDFSSSTFYVTKCRHSQFSN